MKPSPPAHTVTVARRSSMFFESDLRTAAEGAAFEMECHGLTAEQTDELAGVIECAIRDFFKDNDS